MTGPRRIPDPTDLVSDEDPANRTFTIGQVLTVACANLAAHQLFCSYADFLDVVGYLLNDVPLVEEMPDRVANQARPAVLAQHPNLAAAAPPGPLASDTAVLSWLAAQEQQHGERLHLQPAVIHDET